MFQTGNGRTSAPVQRSEGTLLPQDRCKIQLEGIRAAASLAGSQLYARSPFYARLSLRKLLRHSHTGTTMHQLKLFLDTSAAQAHPHVLCVSCCQVVDSICES